MPDVINLTDFDGNVSASTSLRATGFEAWPTVACRTNFRQLDRLCN